MLYAQVCSILELKKSFRGPKMAPGLHVGHTCSSILESVKSCLLISAINQLKHELCHRLTPSIFPSFILNPTSSWVLQRKICGQQRRTKTFCPVATASFAPQSLQLGRHQQLLLIQPFLQTLTVQRHQRPTPEPTLDFWEVIPKVEFTFVTFSTRKCSGESLVNLLVAGLIFHSTNFENFEHTSPKFTFLDKF